MFLLATTGTHSERKDYCWYVSTRVSPDKKNNVKLINLFQLPQKTANQV